MAKESRPFFKLRGKRRRKKKGMYVAEKEHTGFPPRRISRRGPKELREGFGKSQNQKSCQIAAGGGKKEETRKNKRKRLETGHS